MNAPIYGSVFANQNVHAANLKVTPTEVPSMRVNITPGGVWFSPSLYREYKGGTSDQIPNSPSGQARWVLLVLDKSGEIRQVLGEPAASDAALPKVPFGSMPLAGIFIKSADTVITAGMINDLRPMFDGLATNLTHASLPDHNDPAAHSIDAIDGLEGRLNEKASVTDLSKKMDADGTTHATFTLNKDVTGVASEDVSIIVKRGSESDAVIRWNEDLNRFEYTDDHGKFVPFGAAVTDKDSIEMDVIKGLTAALKEKAALQHTHQDADLTTVSASKITGVLSIDNIPTNARFTVQTVASDEERKALTTEKVQKDDLVYVSGTKSFYLVTNEATLSSDEGWQLLVAPTKWEEIVDKPEDFQPSQHEHEFSEVHDLGTAAKKNEEDFKAADYVPTWEEIQSKPEDFTPSTHTHVVEDITDLDTSSFAEAKHQHTADDVTDLGTAAKKAVEDFKAADYVPSWTEITSKPQDFKPSTHTHTKSEISDLELGTAAAKNEDDFKAATYKPEWEEIQSKPQDFKPSTHTHVVEDITDLDTSSFAEAKHQHTADDVTDLGTAAKKAVEDFKAADYVPSWTEITSKPQDFKPSTHTHTKSEISDLELGTAAAKNEDDFKAATYKPEWEEIQSKPQDFKPSTHTHTKDQITDLGELGDIVTHNAEDFRAAEWKPSWNGDIEDIPSTFTPTAHQHTRSEISDLNLGTAAEKNEEEFKAADYVPKWSEIEDKPSDFQPSTHTHDSADINSLSVEKLDGVIDVSHLPKGALFDLVTVANDTERFELTTDKVQKNDLVFVTETSKYFFVIDEEQLESESGYRAYTVQASWAALDGKPSEFKPESHTHETTEITGAGDILTHNVAEFRAASWKPAWSEIDGVPSQFEPSEHTHTVEQISDLEEKLGEKYAAATHNHNASEVTDLQDTLDAVYAKTSHTHTKSDITDLEELGDIVTHAASEFAEATHQHTAEDVTDLQETLDTVYAKVSHNHTISQITDLPLGDLSAMTSEFWGDSKPETVGAALDKLAEKVQELVAAQAG